MLRSGSNPEPVNLRQFLSVFQYTGRALWLVRQTSQSVAVWYGVLSAMAGVLPALITYTGKLIVDAVVAASVVVVSSAAGHQGGCEEDEHRGKCPASGTHAAAPFVASS